MKKVLISALLSGAIISAYSQSTENSYLLIPCKTGEIVIDGVSKGRVEADDALKQSLSTGEHYIQIKTESQKINTTIKIDNNLKSNIIRIGCETSSPLVTKLFEKQFTLSGSLTGKSEDNFIGLDAGDQLKLNCTVLDKNGTANLAVVSYETGAEIYKKARFNVIDNESVTIPKKGIYRILFSTDALFGREVKLSAERIPAPTSSSDFKTTVRMVADTIPSEVLNTTVRVYSTTNLSHPNKTVLKLNLPQNTAYWVYWIGVGQESKEKMKRFISSMSSVASSLSPDPLVRFGLNLIPSLPMLNSTSTINYRFMDVQNAQLFESNMAHSYYKFKFGSNIATDYSLIKEFPKELSLCFWNESSMVGQDVEVRVMAFSVNRKLVMD